MLVVLGALFWVLSRVAAGGEAHAFAPGHPPPHDVHLVSGQTYRLAIHDGVRAAQRSGRDPKSVACSADYGDVAPTALRLTPETSDTKATDTIASFIAPTTGNAHLACAGLPAVYVEGTGGGDASGLLVVLAAIALGVGVPLLLSGLRTRSDVARIDPTAEGALEFERDGEADVVGAGPGNDLRAQRQPGVADPQRNLGRG